MSEWKTTAAHFRLFKERVDHWIKAFGMTQYRVLVLHQDDPDKSYGWFKSEKNTANIGLGTSWDLPPTEEHLEQTALHEVLHLVFDNLTYAATSRFVPMGFIEAEEEEIIARMEKVLLNGRQRC